MPGYLRICKIIPKKLQALPRGYFLTSLQSHSHPAEEAQSVRQELMLWRERPHRRWFQTLSLIMRKQINLTMMTYIYLQGSLTCIWSTCKSDCPGGKYMWSKGRSLSKSSQSIGCSIVILSPALGRRTIWPLLNKGQTLQPPKAGNRKALYKPVGSLCMRQRKRWYHHCFSPLKIHHIPSGNWEPLLRNSGQYFSSPSKATQSLQNWDKTDHILLLHR